MVKFINSKEEVLNFENLLNEIKENDSPFKEILKKGDLSSTYFINGENEEDKICLGECFQLQVNVKAVGVFHFFFKLEGFNKEEVIKKVAILKDIIVKDSETATNKISVLIDVLKQYNPLFMLYKEYEKSFFVIDDLEKVTKNAFPVLYIKTEVIEEIQEVTVGKEDNDEVTKTEKKKFQFKNVKTSFIKIGKCLAKNKFHILLILVSTLLIQVSIPLGIFNIYSANMLYIFLFICAAIGVAMNAYCYIDYFKSKTIKDMLFVLSAITNVVGIGAGIGAFAIFYTISTKTEKTPPMGNLILLGLLISSIIIIVTIITTYIIRKTIKPKNK